MLVNNYLGGLFLCKLYLGNPYHLIVVFNEQLSIFVTLLRINCMLNPPNINFNPPISTADGADDLWKVKIERGTGF